jgi:hypothetical protein
MMVVGTSLEGSVRHINLPQSSVVLNLEEVIEY